MSTHAHSWNVFDTAQWKTRSRQLSLLVLSLATAILAVPTAVFGHEGAHFIVGRLIHINGTVMHATTVSFHLEAQFWWLLRIGNRNAAASMDPFWKVASLVAAGPVFSVLLVATLGLLRKQSSQYPFFIGVAHTSCLRLLAPISFLVHAFTRWMYSLPQLGNGGTDEFHLYLLTGIPVFLLVIVELSICIPALILINKQLFLNRRYSVLIVSVAGMAAGMALSF